MVGLTALEVADAMVAIVKRECGEVPRTWSTSSEQDKWQIAFSCGLMAASEELLIAQMEATERSRQ